MALYFVTFSNDAGAVVLVRAANGERAMQLAEGDGCARVLETGAEGVLGHDGHPLGADAPSDAEPGRRREVEVTSLSDRGVRRYKDMETGTERTEARK